MSTPVIISGTTYQVPSQGETPPWGDNLSSFLIALSTLVNSIQSSTDIPLTSFTITNNQSSVANVTGLSFDTSQVRSAIIQYSIYRSTATNESSECGQIFVTYSSTAGTWEIAQTLAGNSGVVFTITNGGQLQYTSSNVSGGSYSGKMKFKSQTFSQT